MIEAKPELNILALNSGSSSLKFGLYRVGHSKADVLLSGEAEAIGDKGSKFHAKDLRENAVLTETVAVPSHREAIVRIARLLTDRNMPLPDAIGHRVVHGGPKLLQHCVIDAEVLRELEASATFAPLHIPQALSVIGFSREHFPGLPQVACFDTAFHVALPEVARVLPLPKELRSEGVHRYGFHGLSCESIVRQLGNDLPDRLVIAHLGNGASVTSVKAGKSMDTSMGLTPAGGVIMGTRSGDLDPGIVIYLMREKQFDAPMLEDFVNRRSGLLGISDVSSDMRRLHEVANLNEDAKLAIKMFCYSVRKQIAAMIAAIDGADLIVFTGGIGENDAKVRAEICEGLLWIGVSIDDARNQSATNPINNSNSRCRVLVLPSQEDEQIVRQTWALLSSGRSKQISAE
jgi:acetate kinase